MRPRGRRRSAFFGGLGVGGLVLVLQDAELGEALAQKRREQVAASPSLRLSI
jgi:hypothetical protein